MKQLLNSKKKLFYITLLLTAIILTSAYALFMTFTTNTSTASIVGNLMYGISLTDENGQNINYASNEGNSASNVYITVYSLNRFTSKYALGYKSDQNVTVTLLDRNGWNSEGIIPSYSDYAYKRTFKVHIDNNSSSTSKTYFQVFGGYNYEEVDKLILDNGYTKITNTDSSISNTGELLTSIVSEDTNCTSTPCLYGKDTINNYLKLNSSSDMYRVLGNYTINNNLTAKIAATNLLNTTSDVSSTLNTFYNSLDNEYIVETNKFNCSSSGCSESNYTGAGLLTKYEYDTIGGVNSYLNINDNYFILENNNLKELSNDGTTSTKDSSKVRPVLYLDGEVEVLGSGSIDDPFIINPKYDLTITSSGNGSVSKTSDRLVTGASTSLTVTPSTGYYLSSVECTQGYNHTAQTGTSQTGVQNITITNNTTTNGTCTFNFTISSYTLTINKSGNGAISKTSETLNYGGSTTVVVTPDRGHYLSAAECNGNYTLSGITTGSTTEQTATISNNNRINAGTCTFTFSPQTYTVVYNCGEGSGTPPTTQTVSYGNTITTGTGGSCSKTGYTLSKWNDPTGDNGWTNWSGTWSYINGQYGITNNTLTLTAQWTINRNTLAVNPNGGTVTFNGADRTSSTSVTQNYNTTIAVPNPKTLPTYTISYDGNSQGSTYTGSPTSVTRPFSSWSNSGTCGSMSRTTYTFPSNSGTTCTKTASYSSTSNSFTLPAISRTGYTCKWAEGSVSGTQYTGGTSRTITGNKTYYAKCTVNPYTVTISKSGTGTVSASNISVNYGGTNTFTATPGSGQKLSSISCTNGYTATYTANSTSAQTVTIKNNSKTTTSTCTVTFVANSYTIAYSLNGGTSGSSAPTSGTVGSVVTISNPTKTVTFKGNTNSTSGANGTGVTIGSNTTASYNFSGWTSSNVASGAKTGTSSSAVTTSWTGTSTTNQYFKDLASGGGSVTMTANYGSAVTYSVTKPDSGSYTFALNSNGYYESNNKAVANSYALAKLTITNNSGSSQNVSIDIINYAESSYDYGLVSNLDTTLTSSNTADSSGVNWNGSGKQSATPVTLTFTVPTGSHYIYFKYRKDGSVDSNNDSLQFKVGIGSVTLPTVTKSGYKCGWSTSSTGTTMTYSSGATVSLDSFNTSSTSTINLYAVCQIATCTVYCTWGPACTTTPPTNVPYGEFECNKVTHRTGSVQSCWYNGVRCNGGTSNVGAFYLCSIDDCWSNTTTGTMFCNSSLYNTPVCAVNLTAGNYSCSCD